ncbi:S-formylglutathione hydrolase FrmB [Mucilaginibacter gracilis]|uniref:S-formylglutathione hydrolase FrmB n=1 Tax=Mucilaginibacter gracilis TaxID=423350 RepID=A0A495J772_9SPHI|nr:alpha/beta hydrolase family protein [Mucilaginibacter gracilis]RKR84593.1 S-formylglutathione hydrolase FrmB [Mucilaginibacter gracilis]
MNRHFFACIIFYLLVGRCMAAGVETVDTYSASMKKTIKATIIKPTGYNSKKKYPVLYLLHGFGNNYTSWPARAPEVVKQADLFNMLIVCADGENSWYFDSPVDSAYRYETYIAKELVGWVDSHYSTIAQKSGRGISGNSMGGHGALYIAFKHPDVFGAAGSLSGGVDIRPFSNKFELPNRLGTIAEHPQNWEQNTVINMIDMLKPGALAIFIDCGTDDFFLKANEAFHAKLLEKKIPHTYMTREGDHSWDYWKVSIYYLALFMSRYFSKASS